MQSFPKTIKRFSCKLPALAINSCDEPGVFDDRTRYKYANCGVGSV